MDTRDSKSFQKFEQQGWQRAADTYANHWDSLTCQAIEPLLDAVSADKGTQLLDVATGSGHLAAAAADRGTEAAGLDFSSVMVEKARQTYPNIEFHEGDAERLPFSDYRFDAVVVNFGIVHFSRPEQALAEAHRVLRASGRIGFTAWATPEACEAYDIVYGAIQRHGTLDVPLPPGPPFFRFSDERESVEALAEAGFLKPRVDEVPQIWRLPSPEALIDAFLGGTARTGPTLHAQSPAALDAILTEIVNASRRYQNDGILEIPMPAKLASATKP